MKHHTNSRVADAASGLSAAGIVCGEVEQGRNDEVIELVPQVMKLKSILVPIDFSADSAKALTYAVPFAKQFNAKIILLHVTQVQFQATEFAYTPVEEGRIMNCARDRMKSFATGRISPGIRVEMEVRGGVAFDEITKTARELDVDLIVINTHGYTGLRHILMGSTAERVVRHAPCPVFVVREREHDFCGP